jgi:hypothetical protein
VQNPWENGHAPLQDAEIVVSAAEMHSTDLGNLQTAALGSIFERNVLEDDHPVSETVQLQVTLGCGLVVDEKNGAFTAAEELLQSEYLPAKTKRLPSEQSHLR